MAKSLLIHQLLLSLLHHHLLLRGQNHATAHLRSWHHALVHHWCLRNGRAAMAHSLRRSHVANNRGGLRHSRRSVVDLRCPISARSLLASGGNHRMRHDTWMGVLQCGRWSRGASGTMALRRRCHTHRYSRLRHHCISRHWRRGVERRLVANNWRRLRSLADAVGLRHDMSTLLLCGELCLCLLRRKLLPSSLLSGLFLRLSLLYNPTSFFFHFLLVSLGHLLLELNLVFPLRFLLVLQADVFKRLESGETWFKRRPTARIINGGFCPACTIRSSWLQSFIHDEHEALLLGRQGFVRSKLSNGSLASLG